MMYKKCICNVASFEGMFARFLIKGTEGATCPLCRTHHANKPKDTGSRVHTSGGVAVPKPA